MKKTGATESYVFDTSALLTLWNDEEGAETVDRVLRSGNSVQVSFTSYMESRYRIWKNAGKQESDDFARYLDLLPVTRININEPIFEKAIEIKATKNLSVCDSWIVATAITTNSILVHKDPEFDQVEKLVKILTLPYKPLHQNTEER